MKKHLPYFLAVLILAAAGFFAYRSYKSSSTSSGPSANNQQTSKETKQALSDAQNQMAKAEEQNVYTHPDPYFSFNYPKTMNASSFEEAEGETVLLQSSPPGTGGVPAAGGGGGTLGMQIFISPFEEDITLTAERIKKDIPGIKMSGEKPVSVGNITAASFIGQDESLGQTYEVWLVYNKNLYQILSYAGQKDLVNKILETWSWQ